MITLAAAVLLLALGCHAQHRWDCSSSEYLGPHHPVVPCVVVPSCYSGARMVSIDRLSNDSAAFPASTYVEMCYTEEFLRLKYLAAGDPFLKNTYTTCDSETYNQEVVEVFIAPNANDSLVYHEFEITPFNVMYQSLIVNPFMNGTNMTHELVNCSTSGINSYVDASNATHSWLASLELPWGLIGDVTPTSTLKGPSTPVWRFNLFRVLMLQDTDFCTPELCLYGAFSPDFISPPAFHYPEFFAVMVLE